MLGGRWVPLLLLSYFLCPLKGGKCPGRLEGMGLLVADNCVRLLTRTRRFGARSN